MWLGAVQPIMAIFLCVRMMSCRIVEKTGPTARRRHPKTGWLSGSRPMAGRPSGHAVSGVTQAHESDHGPDGSAINLRRQTDLFGRR